MDTPDTDLALVVIGRNEGDRLKRCLDSISGQRLLVVYVDSNSQDQSVALARSKGAHVIELDMSKPFSAARARNAGWQYAMATCPTIEFIQFVDGDCEIFPGWLQLARAELKRQPEWVAVCGRRRERFPSASVYNSLCDAEWNTPIGTASAFGGDVMIRSQALRSVGGYRDDVIAGEEPELCVRLRRAGGIIARVDADMTLHDANIHQFGQWWTRAKRGGYAFALGAHLHGASSERHWVKEYRRAVFWGLLLPFILAVASVGWHAGIWGWLIYPAQLLRIRLKSASMGGLAWPNAWFSLLGKFAEAQGCLRFWKDRALRQTPTIIEYK